MIISGIKTFIINLPESKNRLLHIRKQFAHRPEFNIEIITAIRDDNGARGLFLTILKIIRDVETKNYDYVILCEDDHKFTDHYSYEILKKCIRESKRLKADILVGGASFFQDVVKVSKYLYWTKIFTGTQFLVIFRQFYKKVTKIKFKNGDHIDLLFSKFSNKIFMMPVYISYQKNFGDSRITQSSRYPEYLENLYTSNDNYLSKINRINSLFSIKDYSKISFDTRRYMDSAITTYILPFEKKYINDCVFKEFIKKNEFDIRSILYSKHEDKTIRFLNNFLTCIQNARDNDDDVVVICIDQHRFTSSYSRNTFFKNIVKANAVGCELLLGGCNSFKTSIPVTRGLYWIDNYDNSTFFVIFERFYETIIKFTLANWNLSALAFNKLIVYPFISEPFDNPSYLNISYTKNRLSKMRNICNYYKFFG